MPDVDYELYHGEPGTVCGWLWKWQDITKVRLDWERCLLEMYANHGQVLGLAIYHLRKAKLK